MADDDGAVVDAHVQMEDVVLEDKKKKKKKSENKQAAPQPIAQRRTAGYNYAAVDKPPFVNAVVYYRTIQLFKRLDVTKSGFITVNEYLESFVESYEDEIRDMKQIDWIKNQVLIHCERSASNYVNVELVLNLLNEILRWSEAQKEKAKNWKFKKVKQSKDMRAAHGYEDMVCWEKMFYEFRQWKRGKRPGCCGWNFSKIENKQGASVASYFKFAEKLFFYNLYTALAMFVLMIPGIFSYDYSHSADNPNYADNTYEGLFLGKGLEYSFLFYGDFYKTYYGSFNLSVAWVAVVGAVLLLSLRSVLDLGATHREDIEQGEDDQLKVTSVVFSFLDYSMTGKKGMEGQLEGLETSLIEAVIDKKDVQAAANAQDVLTTGYSGRIRRAFGVFLTIVLIGTTCTVVAVMIALENDTIRPWMVKQSPSAAQYGGLIVPAVVSFFRVSTPFMLFFIVKMENYQVAENHFKHYFGRLFVLRIFFVMVILFQTLIRTNTDPSVDGYICKETAVGVFYYSLIIVDSLIDTFGVSLLGAKMKSFAKRCLGWRARGAFVKEEDWYRDEFPIAINLINIMYLQALIWCGMTFSPALPLLGCGSIAMQIYIKRYQVLNLCRPPHRPMGVAKQTLYFQRLFVISLLVALIPFSYFVNNPVACGPYLNAGPDSSSIPIDTISDYIESLPTVIGVITSYLQNVLLLWVIITVMALYNVYSNKHHKTAKWELKYLRERVRMEVAELKSIIKKERIVLDEAQEKGQYLFNQWMHQEDMLIFANRYFRWFTTHYFDDLIEIHKLTELEVENMLAEWTMTVEGEEKHMEPEHIAFFLHKLREKQIQLI